MKKEEGNVGLDLVLPICVCTILVSFGPYITPYYFPITIFSLIAVTVLVKSTGYHQLESLEKEGWNGRKDSVTQQPIITNRTIGIPGKSQEDLDKFQMYASEIRERQNHKRFQRFQRSRRLNLDEYG